MDFGEALRALKEGRKAWRCGWNGKNMFIYLLDSHGVRQPYANVPIIYERCIVLYTAQGKHQPGWLASQEDMLATDWQTGP